MSSLTERKQIERNIIISLIKNNYEIYDLPRAASGRIISFSPREASNKTELDVPSHTFHRYSYLSKDLHYSNNNREDVTNSIYNILKDIRPFLRYDYNFIDFELFNAIYKNHKLIKNYYIRYRKPMISNEELNRLDNLINKWRALSQDYHYKMTKQQKRKLKKNLSSIEIY